MRRTHLLTVLALSILLGCDGGGGGGTDALEGPDVPGGAPDIRLVQPDGTTPGADATTPEDTGPGVPDGCVPSCEGKVCGDDGCGRSCGDCAATESCQVGQCAPCEPSCAGKECGDDGCSGSCGDCARYGQYYQCDLHQGRCSIQCIPNCAGRACGADGCGGSCGQCGAGLVCNTANGSCGETCRPYSTARVCGTDGCGGRCGGSCTLPLSCDEVTGRCVDVCQRQCDGRVCGDDQCGGRCGYCPASEGCSATTGTCSLLPLTCGRLDACIEACRATDTACPDTCRSAANGLSAMRYDALAACEASGCAGLSGADLRACRTEKCSSDAAACNLDLVCGDPGTKACTTVASCLGGCQDALCLNACLCEADAPSASAARAYAECLVGACPTLAGDCMSQAQMAACMMQWASCMGASP